MRCSGIVASYAYRAYTTTNLGFDQAGILTARVSLPRFKYDTSAKRIAFFEQLEATTFHGKDQPIRVTCSIGIATYPRGGTDWDALFKSTDEALYAAKHGGRNRVTQWNPKLRGAAA